MNELSHTADGTRRAIPDEAGITLVVVIVFMVVLFGTAFSVAGLTRTDLEVVRNLRHERKAFLAAEAGITEALLRIEMMKSTPVTMNGQTFDVRIRPRPADPSWTGSVLTGTFPPALSGSSFVTPTMLAPQYEVPPYTAASAGDDALTLKWVRNGSAIRRIGGSPVLRVSSVGRFSNARRRVVVDLVYNGTISGLVLNPDACPAVRVQGSGKVNFPANVHVNGTCSTAISVGGAAGIEAPDSITVSGGYSGTNISPTPEISAPRRDDPLAALEPPSFTARPVRSGTPDGPSRQTISDTRTIQPGIYYGGLEIKAGGNVTMSPGIYIMAGGGFSVASNGGVNGTGVMIYNTRNPTNPTGAGDYGQISITANRPVTLTATSEDPYKGIVMFQDRANTKSVDVTAGADGNIDGLIYAANAELRMTGNAKLLNSQLLVGSINLSGGPQIGEPTDPLALGDPARVIAWSDW